MGDQLSRGLRAGTWGPSWSPSRAALLCRCHHLSALPSGHHPRQKHQQAPPPPRAPCFRVNSSSPSNTSALFSSLHFSSRSAPSCLEKQNSAWNHHRAGPLPGPATCPPPAPPRAPLRPGCSPERHPRSPSALCWMDSPSAAQRKLRPHLSREFSPVRTSCRTFLTFTELSSGAGVCAGH